MINQPLSPFADVKFMQIIVLEDPDTGLAVELQIFKDMQSGALVGIDASYLGNTDEPVYSPYNLGVIYNDESL